MDEDLDSPGTRFASLAALAVPIPEDEWITFEGKPEAALRRHVGDWLFDEHEELGRVEPVNGAGGTGADAWIPVVVFVALNAAGGVIAAAAGMAFKGVWQRVTDALRERGGQKPLVSRGGAAALAVAEVADRFGELDRLQVEAVEEPSSIAGREAWTMAYAGEEPWIVLLRNDERRTRYVIVVAPDGEILGSSVTRLVELDAL
jgi:hypothetical protein